MSHAFPRFLRLSCWLAASLASAGEPPADNLRVVKLGKWVFIRSRFDARRDLVVRVGKAPSGVSTGATSAPRSGTRPAGLVGKRIAVIEKTPSVAVHTRGAVPEDGIVVSVKGDYGYVVLRLR